MGKIIATVKLTNADDRAVFNRGFLSSDAVRTYEMEMLADTGSVLLALPQDVVEYLGLRERTRMTFVLADERRKTMPIAGPIYVEILGREMVTDCVVLDPASPPLLGLIVLERLDLIPDPLNQTLTVRPESPLRPMLDLKLHAPISSATFARY